MPDRDARHVYRDEEWPHGLRCGECSRLLRNGDRFSERLEAFQDDMPIALLVCTTCAMGSERRNA